MYKEIDKFLKDAGFVNTLASHSMKLYFYYKDDIKIEFQIDTYSYMLVRSITNMFSTKYINLEKYKELSTTKELSKYFRTGKIKEYINE